VLGLQYSLALFLVPNALSFAISAWIMRSRWAGLRIPQILAAGFALAVVVLLLMFAFLLILAPFLGNSVVSEIGARAMMVAPGIVAAQLLRVRTGMQAAR
jgi:hypothetical protein